MENKELMIFNNKEFGRIRTININNQPYFVVKDVAEVLQYSNPQKAIRDHIDDEDKGVNEMDTPGGKQNIVIINESGLYSLIMSSKLPNAKKFKHWITSEVLPTIRKTGGYIAGEEKMNEDELVLKAMQVLNNKVENLKQKNMLLENKIKEDKSKVLFANSVQSSKNSLLIGELAKIIKQNGYDIGQNRFFEWLRDNQYLISRKGND